jgi:hypothetical protein
MNAPRTSHTDGSAEKGVRPFALGVLVLALLAIASAYGSAFVVAGGASWSVPAFVLGIGLASGAMMALGAARDGHLGVLWAPILGTVAIVIGGLLLAWSMPGAGEPLWLGLPRRAAIVLYGVGLLPMFVLPLAYAWTFDRITLRADDIARVRAARSAMLRRAALPPDEDDGVV